MAHYARRLAPSSGTLAFRGPLTPRTSLLADLCNDLVAFHAHQPVATTPQAVFDGLEDAHDALLRSLRVLREADGTRATTDPRALTAPLF